MNETDMELAIAAGWTINPTSQGWWWHWDGNEDHAPFIYSILWSGTSHRYFIQYPDSRYCDEVGGLWFKVEEPSRKPERCPLCNWKLGYGHDAECPESKESKPNPIADEWWIDQIADNVKDKWGCHLVEIAQELRRWRDWGKTR